MATEFSAGAGLRILGALLEQVRIPTESVPFVWEAILQAGRSGGAAQPEPAAVSAGVCIDCGKRRKPHHKRPERCAPCHRAAYSRDHRRGTYHAVIKANPEQLEAHRAQARAAVARARAKKREQLVAIAEPATPAAVVREKRPARPKAPAKPRPAAAAAAIAADTRPVETGERIVSSCSFCFRKFRGEGDFCERHQDKAAIPAGYGQGVKSEPYVGSKGGPKRGAKP